MPEQPRRRSAGLDVVRGVAVLLVMARHAAPEWFAGAGVVGVVLFFALSGWLITGVLVDELRATGGVRLGDFYRRRAARLVPALLLMLAGFTIVTLTVDPIGDRHQLPATLAIALTWTGDLPFGHASPATFHLWTLALEEQFYLAWPLLVVHAVRRQRERRLVLVAAAVTTAGCLATVAWLWEAPDLAYSLPTSWAGCFVIGGGARLLGTRKSHVPESSPRPRRAVVTAAATALAVASVVPLRGSALTYLAAAPAIAVATVVLVLALHRRWTPVSAIERALAGLGVLSYAAYLWNYPLTLWLRPGLGPAAGIVAAAATVAIAWASHRWVEVPAQRRFTRPRTAVAARPARAPG